MELSAQIAPLFVAVMVLVPAAFQDVRCRRIPNLLSLGGFLVGCVAHGVIEGWMGAGIAFAAGFLLLVCLFPFFVLGWLGAGDVKLIAAVGAICGSFPLALMALGAIVIAGALLAVVVLAWRKGLKKFLVRTGESVVMSFMTRRLHYVSSTEADAPGDLPYAVAVAAGGIIVLTAQLIGAV